MSKPMKMSNNIKDYLSVEKIRLKDLEDSIVEKHHNIIQKGNKDRQKDKYRGKGSFYGDLTDMLAASS